MKEMLDNRGNTVKGCVNERKEN